MENEDRQTEKECPSEKENIFENIAKSDILESFEISARPKRVRKRSSILKRTSQDTTIAELDRGETRKSLKRKVSFATTFQVLEFHTEPKISANESAESVIPQELSTPEELLAPPPIPEKSLNSKSIPVETTSVPSILKESGDSISNSFLRDISNTNESAFESTAKRVKREQLLATKSNHASSAISSNQSLQETTFENTLRNRFGLHENEIISIVPIECFDKSEDDPSTCQFDSSDDIIKPMESAGLIIEDNIGDAIFNSSFLKSDYRDDSPFGDDYSCEKMPAYSNDQKKQQASNVTVRDAINMSFSMLGEKDTSIVPDENDLSVIPKSRHDLANNTAFFADPMDITCRLTSNKGGMMSSTVRDFDPDSSFAIGKNSSLIQSNKTALFDKSMDLTCKLPSTSHKSLSEKERMADISFATKEDSFLTAKSRSIPFGQSNKTAFLEDSMDFTCRLSSTKNNAGPLKDYSLMSNVSFMVEENSPVTSTRSGNLKSNKTAIFDQSMDFTCKLPSNKVSSRSHHPVLDSSCTTESGIDQTCNNKSLLFNNSMDFTCKLPPIRSHVTVLSQADQSLDADKSHDLSSRVSHTPVILEESIKGKSMSICPLNDSVSPSNHVHDIHKNEGSLNAESLCTSPISVTPKLPESMNKSVAEQAGEFPIACKAMLFEKRVEIMKTFVPQKDDSKMESKIANSAIVTSRNMDFTVPNTSNLQKQFELSYELDSLSSSPLASCETYIPRSSDSNSSNDSIRGTTLETSKYLADKSVVEKEETPLSSKAVLGDKSLEQTNMVTGHISSEPSGKRSSIRLSQFDDATTFRLENMDLTAANSSGWQGNSKCLDKNTSEDTSIKFSVSAILNETDHYLSNTPFLSPDENQSTNNKFLAWLDRDSPFRPSLSHSSNNTFDKKVGDKDEPTAALPTTPLNDSKASKRKLSDASDYHSPPKVPHVSPEWATQSLNKSSIEKSRNCSNTTLDLSEKVCDNESLFQQDMDFTCLNRKSCVPDSCGSSLSLKNEFNEPWSDKPSLFKSFSQSPCDVFDDNIRVPLYSINGSPLCTKVARINEAIANSPFEKKKLLSDEKTRRFSSQGMDFTCIESERNTGAIKGHFVPISEDRLQIEKIVKEIDSTFKVNVVGMDLTCNLSTRLEFEANLTQLKSTVKESDIPLSSTFQDFDNLKDTSEISSSDSFQDAASAITTCKSPKEELEKIQQSSLATKEKLASSTFDVILLQELVMDVDIQSSASKDPAQEDNSIAVCQTSHLPVQSAEAEIGILQNLVLPSSHKSHITEHGSSPENSSMFPPDTENLNKTTLTLNSCSNSPSGFKANFSYFSDHMSNSRKFSTNESRVSVPYVDETHIPEILANDKEISRTELDDVFDKSRDYTNFRKVVDHENCADALGNINAACSSEIDPSPDSINYVENSIPEAKFLKQDDLLFKIADYSSLKDCNKKPTSAPAFPEFSSLVKRTKMINLKEILKEKRKLHQLPNDQLQATFDPRTYKYITTNSSKPTTTAEPTASIESSGPTTSSLKPITTAEPTANVESSEPSSFIDNLESNSTTSTELTGTTVIFKTKPVDAFIPLQPPPDKVVSHIAEPVKSRTAPQFDVLFKIRSLKKKGAAPPIRNTCPDNNSSSNAFNTDKIPLINLSAIKELIQTTNLKLDEKPIELSEAEPKLSMERQNTLKHPSNRNEDIPDNNTMSAKNVHSSLSMSQREIDGDSFQLLSKTCLMDGTFDVGSFYIEKPPKQSQIFEDSKVLDGFPMFPVAHSTICEGQDIFKPTVVEDESEDHDVLDEAEVLEKPIVKETRKTYVISTNVPDNLQLENENLDKAFGVDDIDPIEEEESSHDNVFLESSNEEEYMNVLKTNTFLSEDKLQDISIRQTEIIKDISLRQKSSEINEKMESTHYQENDKGTLNDITLQHDSFRQSYMESSTVNESIPVSSPCGNEALNETNYIIMLSAQNSEKPGDKDVVKNQTLEQDLEIKQFEDSCFLKESISSLHLNKLEKSAFGKTRLIEYSFSSTESMNGSSSSIRADQDAASNKGLLDMEQEEKCFSAELNLDAKSSVTIHENESFRTPSEGKELNESSYIIMLSCVDPKEPVGENDVQDSSDHEQNKSVRNVLQEELSVLEQNFDKEKLNADLSTVKSAAELAEENSPLDHEVFHNESNKETSIKLQGDTLEKYCENDLHEDRLVSLVTEETSKEKSGTDASLNVERIDNENIIEGSSVLNSCQVQNIDTNADGDKVSLKDDAVIEQLEDDCFLNKEKSLSSVHLNKWGKGVFNSAHLVDYSCSTSSEGSTNESNSAIPPYQPKIYVDAKLWKFETCSSTRLVDYSCSTSSEGSTSGSNSAVQPVEQKVHADIEPLVKSIDSEQERHEHARVCKEMTPEVVDEQVKIDTISESPKKSLINEEKSIREKPGSKEYSNGLKNNEIEKDPHMQPKKMKIDEIANKELLVKDAHLDKIENVHPIETSIVTMESNLECNEDVDNDHMECNDRLQEKCDNQNLSKLLSIPDVSNGETVAIHNDQQNTTETFNACTATCVSEEKTVVEMPSASDEVEDNPQCMPETAVQMIKTFQKDKVSFIEDEPMVTEVTTDVVELQTSVEEHGMDMEEAPASPVKVFKRLVPFDYVLTDVHSISKSKKLLWAIIGTDEDKIVFSFSWHATFLQDDTLWDLRMTVQFGDDVIPESGDSSSVVRKLRSISFESVFNETVQPVVKLAPKIFHQAIGCENLVESYPDTSRLPELLTHCSKAVRRAQDFIHDSAIVLVRHSITIEEDLMVIPIISITLMSKFLVKIPIANVHLYPYEKLTPVTIKWVYGRKINEKALQDKAGELLPGNPYLHNMVIALERMKP